MRLFLFISEKMISIYILAIVFILIAVRQVGSVKLQIWQAMLLGAVAVLLAGDIPPMSALVAINPDVMVFLFGMFIVGEALDQIGYLSHVSCQILRSAKNMDGLLLLVIFCAGIASAFLMNDTLAIIGTPLMLHMASWYGIPQKILLLALAFSVTIGSVMSPIGNPQNLLVAVDYPGNPFVQFFSALAIPTLLNLAACYLLLKYLYRDEFHNRPLSHPEEHLKDKGLAMLCSASLIIIALLVLAKIVAAFVYPSLDFDLTYIAIIGALPIVVFSPKRGEIVRRIDWATLVFFASMFVLMAAVWQSGFFQPLLTGAGSEITSLAAILPTSVILSQFISNVPLVALYLPILLQAGAGGAALIALAAGSTIAGNLTILGAASNVIIIQNAESRSGPNITFWEFARAGIPLTAINVAVYWAYLALFVH